MNFEKLYDIVLPLSEDRLNLYFQDNFNKSEGSIILKKGESLDLGTYFNAFSVYKWIEYTTIDKLKVSLNLTGEFLVRFYGINIHDEKEILCTKCNSSIEKIFNIMDFNGFDLIGVKLTALSNDSKFNMGSYSGSFISECEIKIGITICTFKREKYLLSNLDRLRILIENNPSISVMVVDNGRTLEEKRTDRLQIIHNPNYGGSGGFARGLIEQVNQNKNTHVILMDDDVIVELSSFDRLYSLLRHLKEEHKTKFFAGSMLNLDKPTFQAENTAIWNKIISKVFGKGFDLKNKYLLCRNEHNDKSKNQYAGWWFCCIPINVVKKIGYPLPNFIKGDDIEYAIRNDQEILSMNGVAVWHEAFVKKLNPIMRYFSDRGMLLINHFALGCGRLTFIAVVLLRIIKRFVKADFDSIRVLELALKDLNLGFEYMTSIRADDKFAELKSHPLNKNMFSVIFSIFNLTLQHFINYNELDKSYKNFRNEKLSDQKFWCDYLGIKS